MQIANRESFAVASPRRRLPYDAEVEYLQSSGTQYIDTRVPLYSDMRIKISLRGLTFANNTMIFGSNASTSTSAGQFSVGMFRYDNYNLITSNYNKTTSSFSGMSYGDATHQIEKVGNKTYLDGTLKLSVSEVSRYYAGGNCYIFWAAGNHSGVFANKARANVRSFLLCDSAGNALFDGIAVRVGSGSSAVGYMYDRVGGQLFGNAGTGSFVTGLDLAGGGGEWVRYLVSCSSAHSTRLWKEAA